MIRQQLSAAISEGGAYSASYSLDPAGWACVFTIFKGLKIKYGVTQSMARGPHLLGPEEALAEGFIASEEEFRPTLENARGPSRVWLGSLPFAEANYFGPTEGHTPTAWLGHLTLTNGEQWVKLKPAMPNSCEFTVWPAAAVPGIESNSVELLEKLLVDLAQEAHRA